MYYCDLYSHSSVARTFNIMRITLCARKPVYTFFNRLLIVVPCPIYTVCVCVCAYTQTIFYLSAIVGISITHNGNAANYSTAMKCLQYFRTSMCVFFLFVSCKNTPKDLSTYVSGYSAPHGIRRIFFDRRTVSFCPIVGLTRAYSKV